MVAGKKGTMTQEEWEKNLQECVTRGEMYSMYNAFMQELVPMIDSKFAFIFDVVRLMLDAAGVMSADEFRDVYSTIVETVTERFGRGTDDPASSTVMETSSQEA